MKRRSLLATVCCLALVFGAGCGSKITKENFDKILAEKMTEAQVTSLLGKGKPSDRPGVPPDMTELVWEDGQNTIRIQFKDGKAHGGSRTFRAK